MSGSRANMIKAKGLVTYGSEIAIPEGSMKVADNVNIDEYGVITPRRGFSDFGDILPDNDDILSQILQYKGRILRHFNSTIQFENSDETFSDFSGAFDEVESGIRIKSQESNSNLYFTTDTGIKKISARTSSDFTTAADYIVNAGAVKAVDLSGKILPDASGFLPAQSKVAYRVLFGYTDVNNNEIIGSPSSRFVLTNTSADILLNEESSITATGTTVSNNDYILLYTTTTNYFLWFQTTGSNTEPVTADTIGKTGIEVDAQSLVDAPDFAVRVANAIAISGAALSAEIDPSNSSNVLVSTTDTGDTADIATGSSTGYTTNLTVATIADGEITAGQSANAELTFTLPADVTTELGYFYRVFRSANVTATAALTLNDIFPEDEMNLVLEATITDAEVSAEEITVEDITPESFRAAGLPLYTNPISGEGILKANEQPPIAKDIALFSNHMFYANTKTRQRQTFTIISVDDFTSGLTEIIIGNENIVRTYTFIGTAEKTDVTVDTRTNTTPSGYLDISSANNERDYRVWFSTSSGDTAPADGGRFLVRVSLELYDDTIAGSQLALGDALSVLGDFSSVVNVNDLDITNENNGPTVDATVTSLGGAWAISNIDQGTGEDASQNEALLSGLVSVGQAIDETARSLVRVINKDSTSEVNAYYLSGEADLPGNILLENRSVEDVPFYVSTNDANIQEEFNPVLPITEAITGLTIDGTLTNIEAAGHGLITGNEIFVESPSTTPSFSDKYSITVVDASNFTIEQTITVDDNPSSDARFWVTTTYESTNDEASNRLYYSKLGQPESVPILNYIELGPKDQPIERIIALRDYLIALTSEGVYLVSGTLEPFTSRLLDDTVNVISPDSAANLNNQIFCLTNQGIAAITDSGVSIVSRSIENLILDVTLSGYNFRTAAVGASYENDRAYILWLPSEIDDTVATQAFRYNIFERSWTRWTNSVSCALVKQADDRLYIGDATRPYLQQERKNRNRTDHADRNFTLSLGVDAVDDTIIRISSVDELEIGDVLLQETYLTISQYNQMLRKLDLDKSASLVTDYEDTFNTVPGANMQASFQALNDQLVIELGISAIVVSIDITTQRDQWNSMVDDLNLPGTSTMSKNYKEIELLVSYESIILDISTTGNLVTLAFAVPFVQGNVEAYKSIDNIVQWQPQHYGDPSALKQIREGTIIFDQNNFYSAILKISSDASSSLEGTSFRGKGIAYWGYGDWNDSNAYWGGEGNDIPHRYIIPVDKQRCRYLTTRFEHINAREDWRILGITAVVRAVSSRAYRS